MKTLASSILPALVFQLLMASQEITDKLTVFYNAANAIFFLHVV